MADEEILTYAKLENAKEDTWHFKMLDFILKKYPDYRDVLDGDFLDKMKNGGLYSRYWELLSCCLLREVCHLQINKPKISRSKSKHDLDASKNGFTFAIENVCVHDADELSYKIEDITTQECELLPMSTLEKIQLRLSHAISNKGLQYRKIIEKSSLDEKRPYVISIGLYGLPREILEVDFFTNIPAMYLGVFFPMREHQIEYDPVTGEIVDDQANISYQKYYIKNKKEGNVAFIYKNIFASKKYDFISAVLISQNADANILKSGVDNGSLYNDLIIIHNPFAKNPIQEKLIPAKNEYVAVLNESGGVIIDILSEPQ